MALPWSRKRTAAAHALTEIVRLTGEEHAWWARREVTQVWEPRRDPEQTGEEKRDILAEHFGEDWRTSFGLTPPIAIDLDADADPYRVLGIEPTASWDEVVGAHRDMARLHHPDRQFGQSEDERTEGDEKIRVINLAYEELQVRRGR